MLDPKTIYAELHPELRKLDDERLAVLSRIKPFKLFFQVCMAAVFVLSIHMIFFDGFSNVTLLITIGSFILGILLYGIKYALESKKFKEHFQDKIVTRIINNLGPDFTYEADGKIPEREIADTQLFSHFNKYHSEDLVKGRIGDRPVEYAEIKLIEETHKSGGRGKSSETTSRTVFSGIFMVMELRNSFPAPFWVVPRKWYYSFGNKMKGKNLKPDHPEFCKTYKIISKDPDSSEKLLIKPVLDRLLSINDNLKSKKITSAPIYFAFAGNRISVALPARKRFMEPSISRSVDSMAFLEEHLTFLNSIQEIGELIG